ncbi:hypothetical protein CXM95_06700 [Enterococcus sp. CR-Ec1]|nr:hypothetical protein CXM95_06700 [Enterococcus sp. CR-Ec1]
MILHNSSVLIDKEPSFSHYFQRRKGKHSLLVKQVTNDIGGFSTPTRLPYSVSFGQRVLIPSQARKI